MGVALSVPFIVSWCNVFAGLFFKNLCTSFERFYQPACFFAARFTLRQPRTPVGNATNLRNFSFEDYHYAFQGTLCPVTLAHQIFVFQIYIFIPLIHSAPFVPFSHILLYTNFFLINISPQNIFLIPDNALARNLIIIFDFSSQRPHLNYIFRFNVYSFDTIEFFMKHKY